MMIQKSWHSTMNLAPSTNWYGCPIFQRVEPHLILLHRIVQIPKLRPQAGSRLPRPQVTFGDARLHPAP